MTKITIASGTWPDGATFRIRPATNRDKLRFLLSSRKVSASGAVVLRRVRSHHLPLVCMTIQIKGANGEQPGRNGQIPQWETPSGQRDKPESCKTTGIRETAEETGVKLGKVSLCAVSKIRNKKGSKYPRRSYLTYFVGYSDETDPVPTDEQHKSEWFTFESLGRLMRDNRISLDDLKVIRWTVIAQGYSKALVDAALLWPFAD